MTEAKPSNSHKTILVCQGTGCVSGKSLELTEALEKAVKKLKIPDVKIDFTGCHGFCEQGPVAIVEPEGIFYTQVTVEDAEEIIEKRKKAQDAP